MPKMGMATQRSDATIEQRRAPSKESAGSKESGESRMSFVSSLWHITHQVRRIHRSLVSVYHVILELPASYLIWGAGRCPSICVLVQIVLLVIFLVVGLINLPMEVDTDFASFLSTDVESSLRYEAFKVAYDARPRPDLQQRRLLSNVKVKEMFVYYKAKGDNLLDNKIMERIAGIENRLRGSSLWEDLCGKTTAADRGLCDPGLTVAARWLPTLVMSTAVRPYEFLMTGRGDDPMPPRSVYQLVDNMHKVVFPKNFDIASAQSGGQATTKYLRSAFRFKIQLGSSGLSNADVQKKWDDLARKHVFDVLDIDADEEGFEVSFEGDGYEELQLKEALYSDMMLAVGSVVFVVLYLLFHTRSCILAVFGLAITVCSVPIAYIVSSVLTSTRIVNFTSFLAVFLIVGFGCDVIFVYTDFWNESGRRFQHPGERLMWTYAKAGRASFATTGVTSLSFFANLASVIRALRQFGFFMGLCVMFAWGLISLIFAPLCVLDERLRFFRFCSRNAGVRRASCMSKLTKTLSRQRCCGVVFGMLMTASAIPAVLMVKTNSHTPDLYKTSHNIIRVADSIDQFETMTKTSFKRATTPAPPKTYGCSVENFTTNSQTYCGAYWCEVTSDPPVPSGLCRCFRSDLTPPASCSAASTVFVNQHFITQSMLTSKPLTWEAYLDQSLTAMFMPRLTSTFTSQTAIPVLQNEWESGILVGKRMHKIVTEAKRTTPASSGCGFQEVCYCESRICKMDGSWTQQPDFNLARRLVEAEVGQLGESQERRWAQRPDSNLARRLAVHPGVVQLPNSKQTIIQCVFGLWVNTDLLILGERKASDQWRYADGFEMSSANTQRRIANFCKSIIEEKDLRVARSDCWMDDFRKWVKGKGLKFPVPVKSAFEALAFEFITSASLGTYVQGYEKVWVTGNYVHNGTGTSRSIIRALTVDIGIHLSQTAPAKTILELKDHWDKKMASYNSDAKPESKGAFMISKTFAEADANEVLLMSAAATLAILLILAFVGMVIFTCSVVLSIFVVVASITIVCGLLCVMICAAQWEIGLVEVIAIVYFVGYAVTYSLHIAHKYAYSEEELDDSHGNGHSDPNVANPSSIESPPSPPPSPPLPAASSLRSSRENRLIRTNFAMTSIGGAALGSAITTAGSAVFLVFSTLTIFQKLGTMCLTVTCLSIMVAMFPLPAALLTCGPVRPGFGCGCNCRRSEFVQRTTNMRPPLPRGRFSL